MTVMELACTTDDAPAELTPTDDPALDPGQTTRRVAPESRGGG